MNKTKEEFYEEHMTRCMSPRPMREVSKYHFDAGWDALKGLSKDKVLLYIKEQREGRNGFDLKRFVELIESGKFDK